MSAPKMNVELHCHTLFSKDGLMTFDSLVHAAKSVGLDAVAITDHDTMDGANEFSQLAQAQGIALEIIPGEEKTLSDGSHFIGLFLREPIESGDLVEAIEEIESQGGVCLIPHPFRRKDGLFRGGLERLQWFEGRVAGFELFSAKCSFAENSKARELLSTTLSPFGGSDAHYESDLGECVNVITRSGDLKSMTVIWSRRFIRAGWWWAKISRWGRGAPETSGGSRRSEACAASRSMRCRCGGPRDRS